MGARHLSISVALCTRNGSRFIDEQIASVLSQSVKPDQVILSDDDSTDDTVAQVEKALSECPEIELRIMRNSPPLGVVANFDQATQACSGDLIALCDQDDVWAPNRLELVRERFESNPDLTLIFSDATLIDEAGHSLGETLFQALEVTDGELADVHGGRGYDRLLRRNLVTGATTVLRREVLAAAAPFPPSWVHDEWIAIVAAAIGRVDVLERPLVGYRQHASNTIGAQRPTLSHKLSRLTAPRAERNTRLVRRAEDLVARTQRLPHDVSARYTELAVGKLRHENMRQSLPASRVRRLVPVLRGVLRGDYGRFSRGKRDILRDLVQPD